VNKQRVHAPARRGGAIERSSSSSNARERLGL
jgi:hypothetical protein